MADYSVINGYGPVKMDLVNEAKKKGYHGQGIVVAVIDTGIDLQHNDLDESLWVNLDEVAGDGIDNDKNGFIDDRYGWNFPERNNNPDDSQSHGSHVGGIIAGEDNALGVTGVAHKAKIMAVQGLSDQGWGSGADIAAGIRYAAANGAKVLNLSLGSNSPDYLINNAIREVTNKYGVLCVMASGNEGLPHCGWPARCAVEYGLAVGATDRFGRYASYSNKAGKGYNPYRSPGGLKQPYYVTACGDRLSSVPDNRFSWMTGTSMATPYVAGCAAVLWSENPNLTWKAIRDKLCFG